MSILPTPVLLVSLALLSAVLPATAKAQEAPRWQFIAAQAAAASAMRLPLDPVPPFGQEEAPLASHYIRNGAIVGGLLGAAFSLTVAQAGGGQ